MNFIEPVKTIDDLGLIPRLVTEIFSSLRYFYFSKGTEAEGNDTLIESFMEIDVRANEKNSK